ncbi:TPA: fimbrial protein [Escherichia coli]|nr:fimbrial protein [Escherichia coli]HBA8029259.1 fimbrial protein [Escherichia coli]HBA8043820.1 fimbrial protein [Escherichia coli]
MKKTLIALAVAASAVSGMAHAWTNGDFNGSVDIGGSITVDDYRQKWSWAVGSDINGFNNALTDLTENRTKLTITVNGDKPILLGKTNEAFSSPIMGLGGIPLISITDYENKPVTVLAAAGNYNSPDVFFDLAMKNDAGVKIGTVRVNAQAAGVAVLGCGSGHPDSPNTAESYSLSYNARGDSVYKGGLPENIGAGGSLNEADAASSIIAKFGSLSTDELYQQIKAVYPSLPSYEHGTRKYYEQMVSASGTAVKASSYALGIANGQTIEATFDQAVAASTQWSAPLNVAVTYN